MLTFNVENNCTSGTMPLLGHEFTKKTTINPRWEDIGLFLTVMEVSEFQTTLSFHW